MVAKGERPQPRRAFGCSALHDAAREADARGGDAKTLAAGCGPTHFAESANIQCSDGSRAMEDIARDASGPASPKPGDIAPQQGSRSDSTDKGKLRVFISYSRDDLYFADQLDMALNACGFECVIDRHGISGGEDWKRRLGNLISEADTVVFVLSPTSARSPICDWEVEEATRLGKRILPVICRPLDGASPPARLRERNYIFFYDDPKAAPGSGFGSGLAKLVEALNTDFDWLREHTRLLQRAIDWDTDGRPPEGLLSGNAIDQAKVWSARRPKHAPELTALHLDFIRASEEEAQARLSAQRKQLDEMAAAQAERATALEKAEEALKQAEDAQHRRARIRNIAFVVVSIFAVLAGWLYWRAEQQRITADDILLRVTNIIRTFQPETDIDTQKEIFAVFQTGARRGNTRSMGNLGYLYANGFGVARDYAKAREWYEKAAVEGDKLSMADLGWLYANGQGVAQDYAKAREWFEKSADKDHPDAMVLLGVLYFNGQGVAQDYAKAREWYEKAADKDHANGMTLLGVLYFKGQGVARDYAKARELWEKAADKGDERAMSYLGQVYANAHGVVQDYAQAREWYEKAAAKGEATAMSYLGALYHNGQGVTQDYAKAGEWYEKAAEKGDADAMASLEKLPREAAGAGRYAEALHLQEALTARVEAVETKREGKPGEETAQALHEVAWFALLAGEFTKALSVADRAHALLPDDLGIETNRAHALMFLERGEEAKALYLTYKGTLVPDQNGKLWERVIAEDFAELRKASLTHPMMADIEKELGVSP
jgi:TPR repeat protein